MNPTSNQTSGVPGDETLCLWIGQFLTGEVPPVPPPTRDKNRLIEFLARHGISPLAHERAAGIDTRPDLETLRLSPSEVKRFVAQEMLRVDEFTKVISKFQDRLTNRPVIFKGQALAYTLYKHTWMRPRVDIDILIDKGDLPQLVDEMKQLGYRHATAIDGDLINHQKIFSRSMHGVGQSWDVHWKLSNRPALGDVLTYEHLELTAHTVNLSEVSFLTPNRVEDLVIACMHLVGHHSHQMRLIWLYDIFMLARSLDEHQCEAFIEKAGRSEALRSAIIEALIHTRKYMPGAILDSLLCSLEPLEGGMQADKSRSYAGLLIEDAQALSLIDRLRFVRQHVFPSADYMKERFGLKFRWQLPIWYVIRIGRAIPKLFRRR